MSVRRSFLNWGVFLILLGSVPLAVQLGVVSADTAAELLRLWPLILIGIGLGLLLRLTPYGAVGGVIVAATLGLLIGTALAGGFPSDAVACTGDRASGSPIQRNGSFTGPAATVAIELTCAEIDLNRAAGQSWTASVTTSGTQPVINGQPSSLELRSANARAFGPFGGSARELWQVSLPSDSGLSADLTLNAARGNLAFGSGALTSVNATFNASDASFDLGGATTPSRLNGTLNASSVRILLPEQPVDAGITLNASSLTLCAAPATGLRIIYTNTLGSENFAAAGLLGAGDSWVTPGIVPPATTLRITSNLSSITLDRSGECR